MATRILEDFPTVLIPKTCARCGQDFGSVGRESTCRDCRAPLPPKEKPAPSLSFREKQIVHLVRQAKSNKEIAFELSLTVGTVKEYLYHIFRKLGVGNRTQLALWGRDFPMDMAS
jgi:DNA-binding NarL/FixJ family response regulator